ncbi:MAG: hypothetical protein LCH41_05015 [Armatimonadetes bacterium]|nr:hypothetical protein [Armatimonadota bacterium]
MQEKSFITNEEGVVTEIRNRDSKGIKLMFMGIFLLFPLAGVLWFWMDGHGRIRGEAAEFGEERVILAFEQMSEEKWLEISTPDYADELRKGDFGEMKSTLGKLRSHTAMTANQTRAREIDDKGVILAEIEFKGEFEKRPATIHLTILRNSLESDWFVDDIQVKP